MYHKEIKINKYIPEISNRYKQRYLCKKLLKNTKKSYFENLGTKKTTDNGSFWRTVLPLFTQIS